VGGCHPVLVDVVERKSKGRCRVILSDVLLSGDLSQTGIVSGQVATHTLSKLVMYRPPVPSLARSSLAGVYAHPALREAAQIRNPIQAKTPMASTLPHTLAQMCVT
jgi:hypothetical protein